MILAAIIIAFPVALWLLNKAEAWLEAHDRRRAAQYAELQAQLAADVDRIIERRPPRVYDWECETDCDYCAPPLDPRDVALWGRQILSADEDQIMREATR